MTVSEQIIQVIDSLCEKFGIVIDWTSANVIPYVTTLMTKLIQWEIWSSVAWMVIMVVLTVVSIIATKICIPVFKNGIANQRHYDVGWSVGAFFAIAGLVLFYGVAICVIGTQIFDIIKCCTFPEMYIFEYIQGMINAAK